MFPNACEKQRASGLGSRVAETEEQHVHTRFLSLFSLRVCHPPSRARLPLLPEHVGTDGWRTGPSERTIKRKDAGEFFSFSLRNVAFIISALWRGIGDTTG